VSVPRDEWRALFEALAEQPAQDNTYGYAKSLAEAIFKQHYASDEHYASGRIVWGVNDTVIGILTQIDNMVADMVRGAKQPAQQEPVAIVSGYYGGQCVILPMDPARIYNSNTPLYTSPPPCPTCEALARTVMLDQTSHDTPRKPTDEMVVSAARVLSDRQAAACNVDCGDMWKLHGNDFIDDARAALEAARGIKEKNT